jgi:hypothetical protein
VPRAIHRVAVHPRSPGGASGRKGMSLRFCPWHGGHDRAEYPQGMVEGPEESSSTGGNAGARIRISQALQLVRHFAAHPCPGSAIRASFEEYRPALGFGCEAKSQAMAPNESKNQRIQLAVHHFLAGPYPFSGPELAQSRSMLSGSQWPRTIRVKDRWQTRPRSSTHWTAARWSLGTST